MAYTFKGTRVTGTSEGNFLTPGARVNNTYLNTQTGHVYKCTEVHSDWVNKGWCKWKYQKTDIIGKPTQGVFGLGTPTRDGESRVMTTKWTTYDWQKNTANGRRMTSMYAVWQVNTWSNGKSNPLKVAREVGIGTTELAINLNNFTVGNKNYTRASFFPYTSTIVSSVSFIVYTKNEKGYGPYSSATRNFEFPRKPSISEPSFNAENGQLSFTITTDAGNDYYERYDTRYKMTVVNTRTGKTTVPYDSNTGSTEFTLTYDAQDYMQLDYNQYIKVTVEAFARGFRGKSDTVSRTYYISYPAKASITGTEVSAEDSTGKCTVYISTNKSTEHPIDGVKLEYLANVEYSRTEQIPGDSDWRDTGIVDDAECTALSVAVTELIPDVGKYTWLRVKSWHTAEGRLYRYSEYKNILHKDAPTAYDDEVVILSAEPSKDGKSIDVQLAWNADGSDDATGTEISWSTELDSWKSTKDPDRYEFTWSDGRYPATGNIQYHDSALITIKGLTEGKLYYVKARRYLDGDTVAYSEYSEYKSCITGEIPESIVATCDRYIPAGQSLPVYWTFSGNGMQARWQIECLVPNSDENIILENGEGSNGFAQISASKIKSHAVDDSLTIRVQASAGSKYIPSEWRTVTIVEKPSLSIASASTLDAQPLAFTAVSNKPCDLIVIVSSEGASSQFPTGIRKQTVGDTVHSDVYQPAWIEDNDEFTTTVAIPAGMDFWNGVTYTLTVTAVDRDTGLKSETIENTISIAWAREAVDPFDYVTLTPIDETDDTGQHRKAVQIELTPPQDADATDVYDIYRLSGSRAQLIGDGFPLAYTAIDEYAPFGGDLTLYYRIAIRTQDGDVAYSDFEYNADGGYLRFDWDGNILELPYDITITDGYKKSVDIRQHMDGSSDGYWNKNIERTGSLSTDVIRLEQAAEIDLAKQLARYPGAVFVRTPDGSAYEADVQVSDMSVQSRNITSIAIDATEVGLTQEFMLPVPEEEEE